MEAKIRLDLPEHLSDQVKIQVAQFQGRAEILRTAAGSLKDSPLARAADRYEAQIHHFCNAQPADISYGRGTAVSFLTEEIQLPNGVARQTRVVAVKTADRGLVYDGQGAVARREFVAPAQSKSIPEFADATADLRIRREATPIRKPLFGPSRNAATAIGNAIFTGLFGIYGTEIQPLVTLENTRRAAEMTGGEIHGEVTRNLASRVQPLDISDAEAQTLINAAYQAADQSEAAAYARVQADIAVVPTDTGFCAVSTSAAFDCAQYYRAAGASDSHIREFIGPEAASLIGL